MVVVEVLPGLYLGGERDAQGPSISNFKLVVNCTLDVAFNPDMPESSGIRVPVRDDDDDDDDDEDDQDRRRQQQNILLMSLPEAVAAIRSTLSSAAGSDKVLVHSNMKGRHRTAAVVVAAYIMSSLGLGAEDAIDYLTRMKNPDGEEAFKNIAGLATAVVDDDGDGDGGGASVFPRKTLETLERWESYLIAAAAAAATRW
jgi:hypothetical protein